jgi:hypothetical protein
MFNGRTREYKVKHTQLIRQFCVHLMTNHKAIENIHINIRINKNIIVLHLFNTKHNRIQKSSSLFVSVLSSSKKIIIKLNLQVSDINNQTVTNKVSTHTYQLFNIFNFTLI